MPIKKYFRLRSVLACFCLIALTSQLELQAQTAPNTISEIDIEKLSKETDYKKLASIYRNLKSDINTKIRTREALFIAQRFATALEYEGDYTNALPLRKHCVDFLIKTTGQHSIESGEALNLLARVHEHLGNLSIAIELHKRSLSIYELKLGHENLQTSTILNNLAGAYFYSNQFDKALPLHIRSLEIREKILGPDHPRTANALDALASTYIELGEVKLSLGLAERSLRIREKAGHIDDDTLAISLNNIALIQTELGRYKEALETQERALEITKKIYGLEHEATARCLLNLASTRTALGQHDLAIPLQQLALGIYEKVMGPEDAYTGIALTHLANSNLYQKNYDEALALQSRGLAIVEKKFGADHPRVASALNNLGAAYWGLEDYESALPVLKRNLAIKRKTFGSRSLSTALAAKNLASIYVKLNRRDEGFPLVTEALFIYESELGPNHPTTAETYTHLADYEKNPNSEYSIYLLKRHVNAVQTIRKDLASIGQNELTSYTEKYKSSYQTLASLLVDLERFSEAQQVLDMLKEDEYFQFIRRTEGDDPRQSRASYTASEQQWMTRYLQISNRLAALGAEDRELAKQARIGLTSKQLLRRKQLNTDLRVARIAFEKFLDEMRSEFLKKGRAKSLDIAETSKESTTKIQTTIRNIGGNAALLQYYVTDEKIGILLTTPGIQIARESKIKRSQLNLKISSLLSTLRDPKKDPTSETQEMFRLLLSPVENDLEQADIKTLMISLDGPLRYLPLGALHDGKNYAITRWAMTLYNPVVKTKLSDKSSVDWSAAGLGRTKGAEGFSALPSVESEIRNIVKAPSDGQASKGLLPGEVFLDEAFTANRLKEVSEKPFHLLHIASHFRFSPGTEVNSFLLLGDGKHLTLGEIRAQGYKFNNLELLTLSACETGLGGGRDADGKEIDGLGVLVQKQGAKAVISTLWSVADESTAKFMTDMYRARQISGMNKAQALRQAQLGMLTHKRYSHPFYWAPYTLSGNWQ
jgi:CHAT domain-containing protein